MRQDETLKGTGLDVNMNKSSGTWKEAGHGMDAERTNEEVE
jgi:hypothetical protein